MNNLRLRNNGSVLKLVIWLFLAYSIFNSIYLSLECYQFIQIWSFPDSLNPFMLSMPFSRYQPIATLFLMFFSLILRVFFIIWFYRSYSNLESITKPEINPKWAIWVWFIPVYWWIAGISMLREIWIKQQLFKNEDQRKEVPFVLYIYWGLFVLSTILHGAVLLMLYLPISKEMYLSLVGLSACSRLFAIVSAILALFVFKAFKKIEYDFHSHHPVSISIEKHLID